jgi:hypothetical protein
LGPCTTPCLGCPPKVMLKLDHFSISFGDFSFFCEFFFYIKLKWSSLDSPLEFSFCEKLRMLKKSKNGNTNANVLYPRHYKKCFHYATLVSYL